MLQLRGGRSDGRRLEPKAKVASATRAPASPPSILAHSEGRVWVMNGLNRQACRAIFTKCTAKSLIGRIDETVNETDINQGERQWRWKSSRRADRRRVRVCERDVEGMDDVSKAADAGAARQMLMKRDTRPGQNAGARESTAGKGSKCQSQGTSRAIEPPSVVGRRLEIVLRQQNVLCRAAPTRLRQMPTTAGPDQPCAERDDPIQRSPAG